MNDKLLLNRKQEDRITGKYHLQKIPYCISFDSKSSNNLEKTRSILDKCLELSYFLKNKNVTRKCISRISFFKLHDPKINYFLVIAARKYYQIYSKFILKKREKESLRIYYCFKFKIKKKYIIKIF